MSNKVSSLSTVATLNDSDIVYIVRNNGGGSYSSYKTTVGTLRGTSAAVDIAAHVAASDPHTQYVREVDLVDQMNSSLGGTAWQGDAGTTLGINPQTGTSYTLALTDAGKIVEMNNASANTLTVPPNASVAFTVGTYIDISQMGAGQTTIAAGSGVTIRSANSFLKMAYQYSGATLYKRGTNEWVLTGDLSP